MLNLNLNYSWKASPNRWGRSEFNTPFSIGFGNGLEPVAPARHGPGHWHHVTPSVTGPDRRARARAAYGGRLGIQVVVPVQVFRVPQSEFRVKSSHGRVAIASCGPPGPTAGRSESSELLPGRGAAELLGPLNWTGPSAKRPSVWQLEAAAGSLDS